MSRWLLDFVGLFAADGDYLTTPLTPGDKTMTATATHDNLPTHTATFRLMQESGTTGPTKTVQVVSVQHAKELAFSWSEGQLGHPWDLCTISIPDLETELEMSL